MIKVMSVFGTRPEAIKMAPLIKEIEKQNNMQSIVCVTAQHRDMLDQVMEIFKLKADYDLDIMKAKQTIEEITTNALKGLSKVIKEAQPDIILVHGDTSTTFVGALAAFYNKVTIGHIEAGLRTGNKYSPYPEEMNRKLTGALADIHFSPTKEAYENLKREAHDMENVFITGNTVIDAIGSTVQDNFNFRTEEIKKIDFNQKVILLTAHRRENIGAPVENICDAVLELVDTHKDIEIVYPVHKNPVLRDIVNAKLKDKKRIHLIEPLEVDEMHNLINKCYFVMTDSGGLQEEAPSIGKPVLVLRNETERPEAILYGTAMLAGTAKEKIIELASALIEDKEVYSKMANAINPYGDGKASQRIVNAINYYFDKALTRPEDFVL